MRSLTWRLTLRANLELWPQPSPNIRAIVRCDGLRYDEDSLLAAIQAEPQTSADSTRSVRNTFEALAYNGLAHRDGDTFKLTTLGRLVFSFLGTTTPRRFANDENRALLGRLMINGLRCVPEYRAIWRLVLGCENKLSNEELNRALPRLTQEPLVDEVSASILEARSSGDVAVIGPRAYDDQNYSVLSKREDQRKAMNPQFLLAGAGKVLIDLGPYRQFPDWALPLLGGAIDNDLDIGPPSTDASFATAISRHAGV